MPLSFPWPTIISTARPVGQGCRSCVHKAYCPAYYWASKNGAAIRLDEHMGRQCASWSSDIAQQVGLPTEDDVEKCEYLALQNISSEADNWDNKTIGD